MNQTHISEPGRHEISDVSAIYEWSGASFRFDGPMFVMPWGNEEYAYVENGTQHFIDIDWSGKVRACDKEFIWRYLELENE